MDLEEKAHALLRRNTQKARRGGRTFTFTVPSTTQYPFQWLWDSCFHAIVWSRFDTERAKEELRALFAWQRADGFIPHIIFWEKSRVRRVPWWWHYWESFGRLTFLPFVPKPETSAFTQPPVLAQAVERVVETSGDRAFLGESLPVLERYYRWLDEVRDPDRDGLITIITQFESGVDYGTAYDETTGVRRPTPFSLLVRSRLPQVRNKLLYNYDARRILRASRTAVDDVLVNSVFAQGLHALARLSERGNDRELASWARRRAAATTEALLRSCYDERAGLFFHRYGREKIRGKTNSILSLMPLIVPNLPVAVVGKLVAHLRDPDEYWTPYPIPSTPRNDPRFTTDNRINGHRFLWRGPLTMSTNWFLVQGLRQYGEVEIADTIATKSRELVERHGFNEFFNPLSGEPVGTPDFGWATLAIDMA